MSYEKLSAIKLDSKNNVILLKSHSNNDDATPTWWEYISTKEKSFDDKLKCLFLDFEEGNLQSNSITGSFLKLKYAFKKFSKDIKNALGINPLDDNSLDYETMCKEMKTYHEKRKVFIDDNFSKLSEYLNEKDSGKKYFVLYENYYPIMSVGRYGSFRYLCSSLECNRKYAKQFTKKQLFIIEDILSSRNITYSIAE